MGQAESRASGGFVLRVSSQSALQASVGPSGIVNLELFAASAAGSGSFSFPRRVVSAGGDVRLASPASRGRTGTGPEVVTMHVAGRSGAVAATGPRGNNCMPAVTFIRNLSKTLGTVGSTYMRYSGVTAYFTYGQGQSTTLGVGASQSGSFGSWSGGGTYTWTTSNSQGFPSVSGPNAVLDQTWFIPGKFLVSWNLSYCGKSYYQVQVNGWAGGTNLAGTSIPDATHCVQELAGSHPEIDKSASATFSAGWDISAIGFTGSAQTGWDSQNTQKYYFGSYGHLCGLYAYPLQTNPGPGRVVAGIRA